MEWAVIRSAIKDLASPTCPLAHGKWEDFGEIRREGNHGKREREKEKKRIFICDVTVEFIVVLEQPCAFPLSAGILAVNQIRDLRSARVYINSATTRLSGRLLHGRSLPPLGPSPTILHPHQRRTLSFRGHFLHVSFFLRDAAAAAASAFMRIPAGFRGISDSERADSFGAAGYILRRAEPHPWQDFVSIIQIRSFP